MAALRVVAVGGVAHGEKAEPSAHPEKVPVSRKIGTRQDHGARRKAERRAAFEAERMRDGEQLAAARISHGLSVETCAKQAGVSRTLWRKCEAGKGNTAPAMVRRADPGMYKTWLGRLDASPLSEAPRPEAPARLVTKATHAVSTLAALVEDGKITPDEVRPARQLAGELLRLGQAVEAMALGAQGPSADLPRARPRRRPAQGEGACDWKHRPSEVVRVMRTERVTKKLRCVLSADEIEERKRKLTSNSLAIEDWRERKEVSSKALSEEGKSLLSDRKSLAKAVREGVEERPVECLWIKGIDCEQLVREDTGEVIDTRPLDERDRWLCRQPDLPFEAPAGSTATETPATEPPANDAGTPPPGPAEASTATETAGGETPSAEQPKPEAQTERLLMPPAAERLLGVLRQVSSERMAAGEPEWVKLKDAKKIVGDDYTLGELREAGEVLVERGALEVLQGNPGVWRPKNEISRAIAEEQALEHAQRRADELSICDAFDDLGAEASTSKVAEHLGWTKEDADTVLEGLRVRGAVRVDREGPRTGKVWKILARSERVLGQLRAHAGWLEGDALAELAAVPADDVGDVCGKLILQGLVESKETADDPPVMVYALRREQPAVKRGKKKAVGG